MRFRSPEYLVDRPDAIAELRDIAQYRDVHGVAANSVLVARSHYTVE